MANSAIPVQVNSWTEITANQTLVAGQSVLANGGAKLTLPLPTTFPKGAIFNVGDMSGNGWRITQSTAGQQIQELTGATTLGNTGYLEGVGGQVVYLVAEVADTILRVVDKHGSIVVS